jgi:hypothetical protein
MRLYGVVVILGWVRWWCARLVHVNSSILLAGSRGVGDSCGAISLGVALYTQDYTIYNTQCVGLISK